MTAAPESHTRVAALDLTKGVLVVFMAVYHSLNYSTTPKAGFLYLAFLPPSFILISGFLIPSVYLTRDPVNYWRLFSRLFIRGAKLLSIFTVLNILAQLLVPNRARGPMPGLSVFLEQWFDVYVTGDSRLAVIEVVLPIAYLLFAAPVLLLLNRGHSSILLLVTAAAMFACVIAEQNATLWLNAQLLSAGLVGMLLGRLSVDRLARIGRYRWAGCLGYATFFAVGYARGQTYLVQMIEAGLALGSIYGFCIGVCPRSPFSRPLEILGRYSLLAYIGQIVILQFLVRWIGRPEPTSLGFLTLLFGTLALTLLSIEVTAWMRSRFDTVNSIYKAVFG